MPSLPSQGSFSRALDKTVRNRNYWIVQANQIVQDTHFLLPLTQQKILARLISLIKPHQKSLKVVFSTRDYMNLLGLRWSGSTFRDIRNALKHIADHSFYINHHDGTYDLWRWISHVRAVKGHNRSKDLFVVTFPKELKPYLFNQDLRNETMIKFIDVMLMKCKYSPRLFTIFESNRSRQKVQKRGLNYSIKELKMAIRLFHYNKRREKPYYVKDKKTGERHIDFKYPRYSEFKRNVLKPACSEINEYTEYNLKMRPIHGHSRGGTVTGINVVMTPKTKPELRKRNTLIYCITKHVPRKDWKNWREDLLMTGHFHKVNSRKTKSTGDPITKSQLIKIGKSRPFHQLNMLGTKNEFYNPIDKKLHWGSAKEMERLQKAYSLLVKEAKT